MKQGLPLWAAAFLLQDERLMKCREQLERKLGYVFHSEALLKRALTHPSVSEQNNQRLEFLGDAVLEMCISRLLYERSPELQEGEMTRRRASLVCEDALFDVAQGISLGQCIYMDRNCEASGGRTRKSILSDAMEAVLAAVYLDGGTDSAARVIGMLWAQKLNEKGSPLDAKGALQAYLQGMGREQPQYMLMAESGPMHKRLFEMAVLVEGREMGRAVSTAKKKAEQEAAEIALAALQREEWTDEA